MSIRAYYDVWCDGFGPDGTEPGDCGNWAEGATAMEYEGKRRARKRAISEHGWTHKRGIGDLCRSCFEHGRYLQPDGGEG